MKLYKHGYEYIKTFIESKGCLLITTKGEYKNTHQKLEIVCGCGDKFNVSFQVFSRKKCPKQQCNNCGRKNQIDKRTFPIENLKTEINEKFNNEFEIIGEYINRRTHTRFKHKVCGYEWFTSPSNFLRDSGCPKCNKSISGIDTNYFKARVEELTGEEYSVLSDYTKAINKIVLRHNKCNREYKTTPHDFMSGGRCPMCWNESKLGKLQRNTAQFIQEVREKCGDEYIVVGEYLGALTKTEIRHTKCDNVFKVTPDNLLHGRGCPHCKESRGEKRIRKYLKKNHINFIPQFKIDECKNIKPLPFDFAIFKEQKLIYFIEYDGKQHFEIVPGWGGKKMFDELKMRDNIKNKYCEENNIKIIRIPYWDYENIEEILNSNLIYTRA